MKLKVIVPIISDIFDQDAVTEIKQFVHPSTSIDVCHLDYGPESIECEYDEALCVPNFLEKAREAELEGYDGIISNCFADPGVKAARELLNIPVVGPGEASMLNAALLAHSFSIISVLPNVVAMLENNAKELGLSEKLASIRSANLPVLEVSDKAKLKESLFREMKLAIEEDKAHALILGCTGMLEVAQDLQAELKHLGYDLPVISPLVAAAKMLESLIAMNVKQSKLTYMNPPMKIRA
ncbi:aspartate/glutamate racemase family protein [Aquibacillus albus]|uniref:Allantoin racemase n=1 Tax=Aquibacillus albus TaxID=1168171 RepID=A0ABS2N5Q0_9BACI|nr:aspartate/glutamate racemase family protein [Aquibacillus albus]MBM7573449.1 allantoin racemase [Aquibacillus albus]